MISKQFFKSSVIYSLIGALPYTTGVILIPFFTARLTPEQFETRIMSAVTNAAEVEDIVTLCETTALFHRRTGKSDKLAITPDILETSISRVIVSQVKAD